MSKRAKKSKSLIKKLNASTLMLVALVVFVPGFDFDNDGLSTYNEYFIHKTDPFNPDTDFDQIFDSKEIMLHLSNPNINDSDGDGLTDGEEIRKYGTNPASKDTDGDGLDDYYELFESFTNVTNPDTDGDGLTDGAEVNIHKTDPNDRDTDNDHLSDGYELIPKPIGPSGGETVECEEGYYVGSDPLNPNTYSISGGDIALSDSTNSCINPTCGKITKREGYCT